MKRVTRTFTETVEYDEFEPGDRVRLVGLVGTLAYGSEHVVTEFVHPYAAHEDPVVFVEGHPYGITSRRFVIATRAEEEG